MMDVYSLYLKPTIVPALYTSVFLGSSVEGGRSASSP